MIHKKHEDGYLLASDLWVPRPMDEVFSFFADAGNLEQLTPPWLRFNILNDGPVTMGLGATIDYRLKLYGIGLGWQSEITAWEPPYRFVDEQRRGPYRFWNHEHRFAPVDGGTRVSDSVHYGVPLGRLVHRLFVKRDVERIFRFRTEQLQLRFGADAAPMDSHSDHSRSRSPESSRVRGSL